MDFGIFVVVLLLHFKTDNIFSYSAYGYAPPKHYGYQPHKSYGYQPSKTYGYQQSYSDYGYQPQTNYGYQYKEPQVYGFTYNDAHIDHTINKVKQYAYAQDAYKSQQLNVSEKMGWVWFVFYQFHDENLARQFDENMKS